MGASCENAAVFVYVVLARQIGGEPYILGVFQHQPTAEVYAKHWVSQHRPATTDIQRYTLVDA